MKLYAISDLHVGHPENRLALGQLGSHLDDWLIVAGDVGETLGQLDLALSILTRRFGRVIWVPGNHDLWSVGPEKEIRGVSKYERLVSLCRDYGVLTPEDQYVRWPGDGPPCLVAPLFLLYDYSFKPDDVPEDGVLQWAEESGVVCSDEFLLHPDPFPSRASWCAARCEYSAHRLAATTGPVILVNHFPLRGDTVRLPTIPRFSIWCGTRRTENWHDRFGASAVVYGHLHIRSSAIRGNTRFEEVSFGYPRERPPGASIDGYLREILPAGGNHDGSPA